MSESKKKILLLGGCIIILFFSIVIGNTIEKRNVQSEKLHILCLGVDKFVSMSERDPNTNSIGQADAVYLITVDKQAKDIAIVAIPRDTMVMIEKYDSNLNYLGNEMGQICIQYAYADGMEKSCELTCDRVESLFHDIDIDMYVAININAIMELNDSIGGVEVTIRDEYTAFQMSEWMDSKVLLDGEGAMNYLRVRDCAQSETAYGRLDRIKEYIQAFIPKAIDSIKKDPFTVVRMYDAIKDNMVTDVTAQDILFVANTLKDVSFENINFYTLEGNITYGYTGYEEFYPNIDQLVELNSILQ